MNPPPSPDKFNDSDQQWFDRLQGRLAQASDADALKEADALRSAILREANAASAANLTSAASTEEAAAEAGAQKLLFALRREGLIQAGAPAVARKKPVWMVPSALAASVLVGFLALQALQTGQIPVSFDEPPTMRGEIQTVRLSDKSPKDRAEAIAGQLKAAGLSARLYQAGTTFYVDTDLVPEKLESAGPTLNSLGIKPASGQARIEIKRP